MEEIRAAIFDTSTSIYHTYDKRRMLTLTEKKDKIAAVSSQSAFLRVAIYVTVANCG